MSTTVMQIRNAVSRLAAATAYDNVLNDRDQRPTSFDYKAVQLQVSLAFSSLVPDAAERLQLVRAANQGASDVLDAFKGRGLVRAPHKDTPVSTAYEPRPQDGMLARVAASVDSRAAAVADIEARIAALFTPPRHDACARTYYAQCTQNCSPGRMVIGPAIVYQEASCKCGARLIVEAREA